MSTATPCTCGAGSDPTPKKLLRRKTTKKGGHDNPYSDRGVDKFTALLDEIEEKKRTIYSQFNPDEVSMIRFVHDADNKLKPLVVRTNTLHSKRNEQKAEVLEDAGDPIKEEEAKEVIEAGVENKQKKRLLSMDVLNRFTINQPWIGVNYRIVGLGILVVLMAALIGRYWKTYYLVHHLQAAVCPRIQTE